MQKTILLNALGTTLASDITAVVIVDTVKYFSQKSVFDWKGCRRWFGEKNVQSPDDIRSGRGRFNKMVQTCKLDGTMLELEDHVKKDKAKQQLTRVGSG